MARLLPAAFVLLAAGFAAYAGSFYVTRAVLADYSHCDPASPWTFNPCNADNSPLQLARYYALQVGNTAYPAGRSNGVEGFISAQDVAVHDTANDFIASFLGITSAPNEWVQLGFREGVMAYGAQRTTPRVYSEFQSSCYGYSFAERSTPAPNPRYDEWFRASWAGASGSGCGRTVYIWQFGRGSSFATFDYGFMYVSSDRFDATTEHLDRTHMEPNGTQCFGGGYLCSSWTFGYDLFLWKQSGGYWEQWNHTRPTTIVENEVVQGWASGYFHNPLQDWYEFTTTGNWQ